MPWRRKRAQQEFRHNKRGQLHAATKGYVVIALGGSPGSWAGVWWTVRLVRERGGQQCNHGRAASGVQT